MGVRSEISGWLVPRFPELGFLFAAVILRFSAATDAAVFSAAGLVIWAILRMTRILSARELGRG
ncbi:MAG: hypothetical protein IM644_09220 [Phenylobacterium sp.]|uniref:hypothetical protein n=1 Tax=Phenylobacterium sp. TaxID=1871053 RepID=UPI0025EB40A4|nr:hypothetical protein [Phenylobacterium sp.]MCA6227023.1 hypothetical protein [Phenylobacterium sp.]MCA6232449.1 hypothetical protein [Phenylobacterium sp.]MCA6319488.1 hypothetical protein [Phenylobacterium sp.]